MDRRPPPTTHQPRSKLKMSYDLPSHGLKLFAVHTSQFWGGLHHTMPMFTCTALLGCVVNASSFLVIQRTNVIMLKLLAISRNALVVLCGIFIFGDRLTSLQFFGYGLSVFFFIVYTTMQLTTKSPDEMIVEKTDEGSLAAKQTSKTTP